MNARRPIWLRPALVALLAGGLLSGAAACGGSGGHGTARTAPATTTAATPPQPRGNLLEFGNFAHGTVGAELADTTWDWFSPHVTLLAGDGPNGSNAVRVVGDDSDVFPNQGPNVKIHGSGFKGGTPSWFNNGHDVWRAITMRVPSGPSFTNTRIVYAGDEVHGDNGTGPAPLNISFQRGGDWRIYIRGGTDPPMFGQWIFGPDDGSGDKGGPDYRHHQDWVGGNKPVVLDEPISFRLHWHLADDDTGSFEAWARWGSMTSWRHIVPLKTGIPTSYPDTSGDGYAVYPDMSLYYPTGLGGENAVDYMDGAWSDSGPRLEAWQDSRLGFTG